MLALLVAAWLFPAVGATGLGAASFSSHLSVASDYVFRGISQSGGALAIQGGFDVALDSGPFAGAWASTIDIPSGPHDSAPRSLELDLFGGHAFHLGTGWVGAVTVVRYLYPDSAVDYDYTELGLAASYRDRLSVGVGWLDEPFGLGGRGVAYEIVARQPLGAGIDGVVGLGYLDLHGGFLESYPYGHLRLAKRLGRYVLDVSYFDTGGSAERFFGDRAGGRFALTASAGLLSRPRHSAGR